MSNETEKNVAEAVEKAADSAAAKSQGAAAGTAATSSKIPMLIGLFVLGVAAVYGGQMYLDSLEPKADAEFVREVSDQPSGMERDKTQGFKPETKITQEEMEAKKKEANEKYEREQEALKNETAQ